MELILALILGAVLFCKVFSDKYKTNQVRSEDNIMRQAAMAATKAWKEKVTDKELEIILEDRLYHEDPELLKEIEDAIKQYPEIAYGRSLHTILQSEDALRILMAIRGKLTCSDAICGITVIGNGRTRLQSSEYCHNQLGFIKWINEMLKQNGLDGELFIDNPGILVRIDNTHNIISGEVKWKQMLPPTALSSYHFKD